MTLTRHLVLMGLRGSGKSTVGRGVADRLDVPFVDLDDRTRAIMGVETLSEAWETQGERAFREAESLALQRTLQEHRQVIALGGGTPTAPGAHELLRARVADWSIDLVYLRGTPDTLRARLNADDADRPPLKGASAVDEIEEVFADRDPVYRFLAGRVIEIDALDLDQAIEAVIGAPPRGPRGA